MAIQLVIRHNLEEHEATFSPGELRTFEAREIRIGSLEECECAVGAVGGDVLPAEVAVLRPGDGGSWRLEPVEGVPLFLNQEAVGGPCDIRSGDTVRCGHWTFRFHKAMRRAPHAKSADILANAAKSLAVLILIAEAGVVYWLPRQVRSAQQWELEIARQRTSLVMDELRATNLKAPAGSPVAVAARKYVAGQLDGLAAYVRRHQDGMTRGQWREVGEDLETYRKALEALEKEGSFAPPPALATEPALRGMLR